MSAPGPFIVRHESAGACDRCGGPPGVRHCRACDGPLSRWAYATLEELPDARCTQCVGCLDGTACLNPWLLSRGRADGRPGGGKARRSDGSEIVVEATTYEAMRKALCERSVSEHVAGWFELAATDAEVLAAWNAEYGIASGEPCDHCEGGGEVWGEDEHGEPDDPDCKSSCSRCGGTGTRR